MTFSFLEAMTVGWRHSHASSRLHRFIYQRFEEIGRVSLLCTFENLNKEDMRGFVRTGGAKRESRYNRGEKENRKQRGYLNKSVRKEKK